MVYSNFSQKNLEKNEISKLMRNGRFHFPKCRGKVQNIGVPYIHSSKMGGPSSNFFITPKKKKNKNLKKMGAAGGAARNLSDYGPRQVDDCWSPASTCHWTPSQQLAVAYAGILNSFLPKISHLLPAHIFLHMWSTLASWLQRMPALPKRMWLAREPGVGSGEQGVGSREWGAGSGEQGAGKKRAGSRDCRKKSRNR
jgi:hypothetical protein